MPREESKRKERIPMGVRRQRLTLPERKGFHRHWFNDSPGRIEQALEAGYTPIIDESTRDEEGRAQAVTARVGVAPDGSVLMAHAMEIPVEFYDQDQAEKQAPLDEFDAELRRGTIDPERGNAEMTGADRGKIYHKSSSIKRD